MDQFLRVVKGKYLIVYEREMGGSIQMGVKPPSLILVRLLLKSVKRRKKEDV